jgi:hypothetical protein
MTPISALYRRADDHPRQVAFITGNEIWTCRRPAIEPTVFRERCSRAVCGRAIALQCT